MVKAFPYHLLFKKSFKIASVERLGTENLYLKFEKEGFIGWGEAVFPPYISENQETALKRISSLNWDFADEKELLSIIAQNQKSLKNEPSLACAMETCLLNWLSAKKGKSLAEVMGLEAVSKQTSFTIGISSNEDMEEVIKSFPQATFFKLKVNQDEIERIVNHYKRVCDLPFVVDANQGFNDYSKAKYWADKLWSMGVAYFEQPFHKEDSENHKRLTKETNIPIIADESFQRFEDLTEIQNCFNGVNVKIIKTGGVLEAQRCLQKAKDVGMQTILGCMSGSEVSITSASSLSSLANYVDLDGVFLIKNNPDLSSFV